ncbi:hypothetical protein [Gaoshiqia sp. Z1-71]|uniref:hypothetical protein n=1 Tax=Gaoshiqia hydrogeniformans TaxID=3290090 RepID=UPI003BF785BD
MEIYFDQPYSFFLIIVCVLTAALVAFFQYRENWQREVFTPGQVRTLFVLRFLSVFILCVLLLGPAVRRIKQSKIKPVLIFAADNSQSLAKHRDQCEELINQAKKTLNDFQIEYWTFGENAKINQIPDFSELRSDYSGLINSVADHYLTSTIGAMVILGDGLYNSGNDPVFESRSLPFPVYTLGVGDTTLRTDAAIRKVNTNQSVFLNSYFPVEIDLAFNKAGGQLTHLTVLKNEVKIYESTITISTNEYFHQERINLKAENEGINHYSVLIDPVASEENTVNNRYDFTIHVISEKQKILFWSHGSHPDLAAIIKAIGEIVAYEWELKTGDDPAIRFDDYSLVITHQLPDGKTANSPLFKELVGSRIPVLFIGSSANAIAGLHQLPGETEINTTGSYENAIPLLNVNFSLFTLEKELKDVVSLWPPLLTPFGNIKLDGSLQTLFYQRVQSVETVFPLVAAGRLQGKKLGFILGEGIWRWRLYNYLQNGSHQSFDNFVKKLINYLILSPNEDNFNLFYQKEYQEDNRVVMQAEFFNDSYEAYNELDISLQLKSDQGVDYSFIFDKTNDQYKLDMGSLPAGIYVFEAVLYHGEREYREEGSFQVTKLQLEFARAHADFRVLFQIAANTGGNFYPASGFNELKDELNNNVRMKEQKVRQLIFQEFISLKWLFFFVLLALTLEWFLKKLWGSY